MPPEAAATWLRNAALRHLARFPASAAKLGRVLERRARLAVAKGDLEADEAHALVASTVADLVARGLVDDRAYAEGRARAMVRRGRSRGRIRQVLATDGIDRDLADAALRATGVEADTDQALAVRYARRRGLGPFRDVTARAAARERDLRALVRQGFPLPVARAVIDASDAAALDDPFA